MTPTIEAVARALAQQSIHGDGNGFTVDTVVYDGQNRPVPYWRLFIPDARAALAAIREPTPGMIEAMMTAFEHNGACADLWTAAIDAAMEE